MDSPYKYEKSRFMAPAQNRRKVKMNTHIIGLTGSGWLLAAVFLAIPAAAQPANTVTNLITFDDLPDLTTISDGYGQLDWSGLQTITAIGGGYSAGVISHPNSAYNPYGYDAAISSGAPFDLVSAYLTSGAVPTTSLEVLGITGTNLLYDQTYELNDTNSTLVTFNYAGVTQVTFRGTIGQSFVMDNLTVSSAAFTNTTPPARPTLPTNAVAAVTNVLGFDDLPDMSPVPLGYAGLNWSGFDALGELDPWFGGGYENGLVSPPNVVFNSYGGNGEISASTPFNLVSAYLTAGLAGMQVKVVGYVSNYLAYDQIYALSETAPTFVTFNYFGVTDVAFIPEPMTQFVMDNLTVSGNNLQQLPPPSASSPPTNANSMVNLGTVVASSIGHEFFSWSLPGILPPIPPTVDDFLVDQTQTTGGGAVLPSVQVNFDTNNQFELTIAAPAGMQFAVHVPPDQSVSLVGDLQWDATGGGSSSDGATTVSFAGLSGTAPDLGSLTAVLSPQHNFFGYNNLYSNPFTNSFSFTSMTLTGTVPSLNLGLGSLTYTPETDSRLGFSHSTTATNDPGPFVSLEAAPPLGISAALLGVRITPHPNGDVTLAFAGTLQSSTNFSLGFTDVPTYPRGLYTIPQAQLKATELFRVRQ
jgi:hypothetical protein